MFATKTISPKISLDSRMAELISEETINPGDSISYVSDTGERLTGIYLNLWLYRTAGRENSPFVGDNRVMAYVSLANGGTDYADTRTIRKALKV